MLVTIASAALWLCAGSAASAETCTVHLDTPEVVFPLEKMEPQALCRLAGVVNDYTTYRIVPPLTIPIQKSTYDFLLDRPVLATALVRNLAMGTYRLTQVGPGAFQGEDGEGADGMVTLLYQDTTRRIYHLKGSQRGYVFPQVTGEGIAMLNYHVKLGADGREVVETRVTVYSRLDNPLLATLVRVLRPVLQRIVNGKLTRAVDVVHKLGRVMAAEPERVLRQAEKLSDVDKADVEAFQSLFLPSYRIGKS
jgi:hypothetical protein